MRSPGDAVYLGPTFFWKIAPKVLISTAWKLRSPAARSARQRRARPDGFSRHQATLLIEFEF
jgi:hypothetical protein